MQPMWLSIFSSRPSYKSHEKTMQNSGWTVMQIYISRLEAGWEHLNHGWFDTTDLITNKAVWGQLKMAKKLKRSQKKPLFYVWQSDTKCVGEVRNCVGEMKRSVGEMKQSVGEMKQTVGETKRFVGDMKQIWWGNEATWWVNEAKCVGEMPHRQSEITPVETIAMALEHWCSVHILCWLRELVLVGLIL